MRSSYVTPSLGGIKAYVGKVCDLGSSLLGPPEQRGIHEACSRRYTELVCSGCLLMRLSYSSSTADHQPKTSMTPLVGCIASFKGFLSPNITCSQKHMSSVGHY